MELTASGSGMVNSHMYEPLACAMVTLHKHKYRHHYTFHPIHPLILISRGSSMINALHRMKVPP